MDKHNKVSFCITCKGRKDQLSHTLPLNLKNNADYPNTEFVVLDYDSQDGLAEWIKQNFQAEIDSGTLRYARLANAPHFKMAHAKNMAHRIATGDILCNLDADNISAPGFASWLNQEFSANPDIYVRPHRKTLMMSKAKDKVQQFSIKVRSTMLCLPTNVPESLQDDLYDHAGLAGRIAVSRNNFMRVRGYDEKYGGWGGDDINFEQRLRQNGVTQADLPSHLLGKVLRHDDTTRVVNMSPDDKSTSLQSLIKVRGWRHRINQLTNLNRNAGEEVPAANSDGNFGCGKVLVNFGEEISLLPVKGNARVNHNTINSDIIPGR